MWKSSLEDYRPRDGEGCAQGRNRKVLRRRYFSQTQVVGETESGQEAYAPDRPGASSPVGIFSRAEDGLINLY